MSIPLSKSNKPQLVLQPWHTSRTSVESLNSKVLHLQRPPVWAVHR